MEKPLADSGMGPINSNEIYPLGVFQKRTGLGDWAVRKLRRDGFKVVRVGNRSFVDGEEFLRLVRNRQ